MAGDILMLNGLGAELFPDLECPGQVDTHVWPSGLVAEGDPSVSAAFPCSFVPLRTGLNMGRSTMFYVSEKMGDSLRLSLEGFIAPQLLGTLWRRSESMT